MACKEMAKLQIKVFKNICMVALWAILFVGCRAEEQGRILRYEPGVYKGESFSQLPETLRKQLRQRTAYQGSGITSGGGIGSKQRNVRKPNSSRKNAQNLKKRIILQGGSSTN